MKRILLLLPFLITSSVFSGNITAFFHHASFNVPGENPYIETYLSIVGNSLAYKKNAAGKFQGEIEISLLFKQGEDIKAVKKYTLLSPEISDTTKTKTNFIDQQRFSLPAGKYQLELSMADKNKTAAPFLHNEAIEIDFPASKIGISDVEWVESYTQAVNPGLLTKSGHDIIPYISNFYPENLKTLRFYCEIYHTDKAIGPNEKYVINYSIESAATNKKMADLAQFAKFTTAPANVVLAELPIEKLPTGSYNLCIEVKDKNNQTLSLKKAFFQRINPNAPIDLRDLNSLSIENTFVAGFKSKDSLVDAIRSLRPISTEQEKNYIETQLSKKDMLIMQQYFLAFWTKRNEKQPDKAWFMYNLEVQKVNYSFGTPAFKGYTTDRGRVYLQYGPPDQRNESPMEPSAYPYEIWQYYRLKDQTNRKFVFMNTDMVTNDYKLIHSDARGEINDPNWQLKLHSRDTRTNNYDIQTPDDHFGGRAGEIFQNPR